MGDVCTKILQRLKVQARSWVILLRFQQRRKSQKQIAPYQRAMEQILRCHREPETAENGGETTFSYDRLKAKSTNPVRGIDYKQREAYLSEAEFQKVLGMTKEAFYRQPKWSFPGLVPWILSSLTMCLLVCYLSSPIFWFLVDLQSCRERSSFGFFVGEQHLFAWVSLGVGRHSFISSNHPEYGCSSI
nr:PREDICTED: uncharacterized protein LOC108951158 [Musa acuminata subsp. malaccensis]